jgi:hypothetical protein
MVVMPAHYFFLLSWVQFVMSLVQGLASIASDQVTAVVAVCFALVRRLW